MTAVKAAAGLGLILACLALPDLFATRADAAFPGTNGKIAFTSLRDGNLEVYVMNADGSAQTRLTTDAAADDDSAFSPDGQKIAFSTLRDGNLEVYVMNVDGSAQTRLTTNAAEDSQPAFSPDGQKIAFSSSRDGSNDVYVMNADGSAPTRLTTNAAADFTPAFSPDGQKIAFSSERDGNLEVYVMNADGSAQTRLTTNAAADHHPAFSPDGQKVAFSCPRDANFEVCVMNVDGSAQTRLTTNAAEDSQPAFSPDGQKIAFTTTRHGNTEIDVMNADGTGVTNVTNNAAGDFNPDWQPLPAAGSGVQITSAPPNPSSSRSARFEFATTDPSPPAGRLECRLDGSGDGGFTPCSSPLDLSALSDGEHLFEVRHKPDGAEAGAAASHGWRVDGSAPGVVIDSAPSGDNNGPDARIEFHATEDAASFRCSLDNGPEFGCVSPHDLSNLARGPHTFSVRALDSAGNFSLPATVGWVVGCPSVRVGFAVALGCFEEVQPGSGIFETAERAWVGGFEILPRNGGRLVLNTRTPALSTGGNGVNVLFGKFRVPIPVGRLPVGTEDAVIELGQPGTVFGVLDLPVKAEVKVAWGDCQVPPAATQKACSSATFEAQIELKELADRIGELVTLQPGEQVGERSGKFGGKLENGKGFVLQEAEVKVNELAVSLNGLEIPRTLKLKNMLLKFELKDDKPFWTGRAGMSFPLPRGGTLDVTGTGFVFNGAPAGIGFDVVGSTRRSGRWSCRSSAATLWSTRVSGSSCARVRDMDRRWLGRSWPSSIPRCSSAAA